LTSVHISDIAAWFNIDFMNSTSNPLYNAHHLYLDGEEVKDLVIPNSVTSISSGALWGCSGLTSVTIGSGVTSIGYSAFANCPELLDVYCYAEKVPSTYSNAFDGSYPEYITLHVPAASIGSYKTTEPWSSFGKFKTLDAAMLVESITLSQSSATMTIGETLNLTATVTPDDATDKSITWSSSNTSVASVDADGKVTAKAEGTATITATANDGSGVKASCEVTVEKKVILVNQITLSQTTATLTEGETLTLIAKVTPDDATDKSITWSSSNTNVASVDADGKVTAKAEGTATITATANDGSGVKASCELTVNEIILGKCATPVVSYADGKLSMACETEGAVFVTKIVALDHSTFYDAEVELSATYNIEVYASKANFENSDTISVALVWVENGDVSEETGVISVEAAPVLIQGNGGVLNISGIAKDTEIVVYTISGTEVVRATAAEGTTSISTGLQSGTVVIVKFGNKSVKVKI
jgi:hypothetical protein